MASKKTQNRSLEYDRATRMLTITAGKVVEEYKVAAIRDEAGTSVLGYRLLERDGQSYDVRPVSWRTPSAGSCAAGRCGPR